MPPVPMTIWMRFQSSCLLYSSIWHHSRGPRDRRGLLLFLEFATSLVCHSVELQPWSSAEFFLHPSACQPLSGVSHEPADDDCHLLSHLLSCFQPHSLGDGWQSFFANHDGFCVSRGAGARCGFLGGVGGPGMMKCTWKVMIAHGVPEKLQH